MHTTSLTLTFLPPSPFLQEQSKFDALESYLTSMLGQKELIRSKLENPLGVADRVIADTLVNLERRTDILEADVRILEMIEENMNVFKKDIERDVQYYRQHVKLLVTQVHDGQQYNN